MLCASILIVCTQISVINKGGNYIKAVKLYRN